MYRFHPSDGSLVLLNIQGDAREVANPAFSRHHPRLNVVYTCTEDCHENIKPIFKVYTLAQDGDQFISLVTRANQSVECIGQLLEKSLSIDSTYLLEIYLNSSEFFESRTSIKSTETADFNIAADLEVYGLTNAGQYILIDVYEDIKHYNWKKYTTTFKALKEFAAIEFRAFFTFDQLLPYNGHILIDNITLSRL